MDAREKERTPPHMVMHKTVRNLLRSEILKGIRPQYITHEAVCWWFTKTIDLKGIIMSTKDNTEDAKTDSTDIIKGV